MTKLYENTKTYQNDSSGYESCIKCQLFKEDYYDKIIKDYMI